MGVILIMMLKGAYRRRLDRVNGGKGEGRRVMKIAWRGIIGWMEKKMFRWSRLVALFLVWV